jgi:orotidine-5'-phosphate decarboxylase
VTIGSTPMATDGMAEPHGLVDRLRDRLALALDVDDIVEAARLARDLRRWFAVAKIGLELFSAAGPDSVLAIADEGYRVLLDLKLHDIPTTVGRSSRVLGALGVSYLTMHAAGGVPMLRAGVEGLAEGAASAGLEPPIAVGVTVLTSQPEAPVHVLQERVGAAIEARCGGVVCAATDLAVVKELGPALVTVVPGTRLEGRPHHDQSRVATPADALQGGADLLVIGRAVTAAADRARAAAALVESMNSVS